MTQCLSITPSIFWLHFLRGKLPGSSRLPSLHQRHQLEELSTLLVPSPIRAPRLLLLGSDWLTCSPPNQSLGPGEYKLPLARSDSHTHSPQLELETTPAEPDEIEGRVVILKQNWDALPRRREMHAGRLT